MELKFAVNPLIEDFTEPSYATNGSSGMDIYANLETKYIDWLMKKNKLKLHNANINTTLDAYEITINPSGRALIPTGIIPVIEWGYELQIRPRSGLALNNGITVLNTPGTIDADYRGEIGIILINTDPNTPVVIKHGARIAQMVGIKIEYIEIEKIDIEQISQSYTDRGEGGFGHTGK